MYFWQETYENIWDSVPKPRGKGPGGKGRGGTKKEVKVKCLCQEEGVLDHLDQLLQRLARVSPDTLVRSVRTQMTEGLCCCHKECKHTALNLPKDMMEEEIWNLYTFFLNAFNIYKQDDSVCAPVDVSTGMDTPEEQSATSKDLCDNHEAEDISKETAEIPPETRGAVAQTTPDAMSAAHVQNDDELKDAMLCVLHECLLHRDVHRYILLQEVRAVLHYLKFTDFNDDPEIDCDDFLEMPPLDWMESPDMTGHV